MEYVLCIHQLDRFWHTNVPHQKSGQDGLAADGNVTSFRDLLGVRSRLNAPNRYFWRCVMQKFIKAILVFALTACTAMPQNARQLTQTPTLPTMQHPTLTNTPILTLPSTPTRLPILQVGGSGSQTTIQSAINAALDGDTIQVAQGSYMENISIPNSLKNIRIEGGWTENFSSRSDDNSLTIIDGGAKDRVINISNINSGIHSLTIEGFTIRNGMAEDGGAIYCQVINKDVKMTLSLINNTIEKNVSRNKGGGLYLEAFDSAALDLIMKKIY
jgi:hypothetical protein